jgi:repressor LexA
MPDKNIIDMDLYISIGKQLKNARKSKGISLDTLSNLINGEKTKSTLKRYEDGNSRIEMDTLKMICDKIGIDYLDVITKAREDMKQSTAIELPIKFDDYFPLHYSTNLSAGTLEELLDNEPDAIVYVPIRFQMIKNRLHAFKVNGTSMNNVIQDGSIVITEDISDFVSIQNGTIVVVLIDGEATVKRLYVNENQLTLMPDSSDKSHLPIIVDTEVKQVYIVGRVIWHMNPDDICKNY